MSQCNNGAGTDLCGYSADGRRRWVHQLAQHKGIAGMGTVDDIANAYVYLASDESSFVTGAELAVDGGASATHAFGG